MKGTLITIPADESQPITREEVTAKVSLQRLQDGVGGLIEEVPHWREYADKPSLFVPAVVWCNEEGKIDGLPVNPRATKMWHERLRANGLPPFDMLAGTVVVCIGDKEFLGSL